MKPRVKFGLLVGIAALIVTACANLAFAYATPIIGIIAGLVAGFLAARGEDPASRSAGAGAGAVSALIAALFLTVGELLGGVLALFMFNPPLTPDQLSDPTYAIGYAIGGVSFPLSQACIGFALCIVAGAVAGALASTPRGGSAKG